MIRQTKRALDDKWNDYYLKMPATDGYSYPTVGSLDVPVLLLRLSLPLAGTRCRPTMLCLFLTVILGLLFLWDRLVVGEIVRRNILDA